MGTETYHLPTSSMAAASLSMSSNDIHKRNKTLIDSKMMEMEDQPYPIKDYDLTEASSSSSSSSSESSVASHEHQPAPKRPCLGRRHGTKSHERNDGTSNTHHMKLQNHVSFSSPLLLILDNGETSPYASEEFQKSDYWYTPSETRQFCRQTIDQSRAFQLHKLGHHGRYNRVLARVYRECCNQALLRAMMGDEDTGGEDESEEQDDHEQQDSKSSILSEKDARDLAVCMQLVGDERCGLETASIPGIQKTILERRRALHQRLHSTGAHNNRYTKKSPIYRDDSNRALEDNSMAEILSELTLPSVWYAREIAVALAKSIVAEKQEGADETVTSIRQSVQIH